MPDDQTLSPILLAGNDFFQELHGVGLVNLKGWIYDSLFEQDVVSGMPSILIHPAQVSGPCLD